MRTYTHPAVLTTGVEEGWADPITDPAGAAAAVKWAYEAVVTGGQQIAAFIKAFAN